jgi:hypothetical protein
VSSNLHIAVFDYDPGFASNHDICGRVSVDLANLRSDTEYLRKFLPEKALVHYIIYSFCLQSEPGHLFQ